MDETRVYQRGARAAMLFVRRDDHMRIGLWVIGKQEDTRGKRSKSLRGDKLTRPVHCTALERRRGLSLTPLQFGKQPERLYHEVEKGAFVLAVSCKVRVWGLSGCKLQGDTHGLLKDFEWVLLTWCVEQSLKQAPCFLIEEDAANQFS